MDEPVARYFDKQFKVEAAKILPGQYHATPDDVVIVTVLGSCVSACLWDPARHIGGMNHFMLPGAAGGAAVPSANLGVYAMEVLINRMLKLGAERRRMVAKVFGGASVLEGMDALNVGTQNGTFVLEFLAEEGIPVVAQDLYDVCPRKVYFFAASGKVMVKRLGALRNDTIEQRERDYLASLERGRAGEVEIFGRR
ncbi:MAG TPA: chemoreceptor glutamine deamidase CheD [Burkholderiales bacterium]|nr:chemoreceptor glutamine deamidase CheD [Burkholderiales bacterium]